MYNGRAGPRGGRQFHSIEDDHPFGAPDDYDSGWGAPHEVYPPSYNQAAGGGLSSSRVHKTSHKESRSHEHETSQTHKTPHMQSSSRTHNTSNVTTHHTTQLVLHQQPQPVLQPPAPPPQQQQQQQQQSVVVINQGVSDVTAALFRSFTTQRRNSAVEWLLLFWLFFIC